MVRPHAPPARNLAPSLCILLRFLLASPAAAAEGAEYAARSTPTSVSPPDREQAAAGQRPDGKAKPSLSLAGLVSYGDGDDSDSADDAPPSPSARRQPPAAAPRFHSGPDRSGWVECVDPTSGESYYWHRGSHAVQWAPPDRFLGIDGREHGNAPPRRPDIVRDASPGGLATDLARLRRATQLDGASKRACASPALPAWHGPNASPPLRQRCSSPSTRCWPPTPRWSGTRRWRRPPSCACAFAIGMQGPCRPSTFAAASSASTATSTRPGLPHHSPRRPHPRLRSPGPGPAWRSRADRSRQSSSGTRCGPPRFGVAPSSSTFRGR